MNIIGIDIGGTKCAVVKADEVGNLLDKVSFPTKGYTETLARIFNTVSKMQPNKSTVFGVSCGGPLDAKRGMILSPPNLPGWDEVPIVDKIVHKFGGKAFLMNDANAGALAEWKFGVGKSCRNLIFLTFGTGMGAGFILNGELYEGSCGMAGEVGHIRLATEGPIGYGKKGSFEGFCSGGGLAQMAHLKSNERITKRDIAESVTAKDLALAAKEGNKVAQKIFAESGRHLGRALSILIDIINPEIIILGGIFSRCKQLMEPYMYEELEKETLPVSLKACRVVASSLGEKIGDYAAVSIAIYNLESLAKQI